MARAATDKAPAKKPTRPRPVPKLDLNKSISTAKSKQTAKNQHSTRGQPSEKQQDTAQSPAELSDDGMEVDIPVAIEIIDETNEEELSEWLQSNFYALF